MPTYEYRCDECGTEFEYLVLRPSDQARCPECESTKLEKLISLPAVSSEHTRRRARQSGLAQSRRTRKERQREDHKDLHRHLEDEH